MQVRGIHDSRDFSASLKINKIIARLYDDQHQPTR